MSKLSIIGIIIIIAVILHFCDAQMQSIHR
jgi:hypothetical protein